MIRGMEVGGGVAPGRVVTATDVAAGHADAQVHPAVPIGQALLAARSAGQHGTYRAQVRAATVLEVDLERDLRLDVDLRGELVRRGFRFEPLKLLGTEEPRRGDEGARRAPELELVAGLEGDVQRQLSAVA